MRKIHTFATSYEIHIVHIACLCLIHQHAKLFTRDQVCKQCETVLLGQRAGL